jgi:hypothetical protein
MSKIKVAATAAFGVVMAGAIVSNASAQPGRYYDRDDHRYEQRYDRRDGRRDGQLTTAYVDRLNWRIQEAAREGRIGWNQARDMQRDLARVHQIAYRYETGQARDWEVDQLQRTVSRIDAVAARNF